MPIYEFRCPACGERFEELVAAGTRAARCPGCGEAQAERAFSAPATPFQLVKSGGETRRQERRNAELGRRARQAFKDRRRRARQRKAGDGG